MTYSISNFNKENVFEINLGVKDDLKFRNMF